MQVTLTKHEPVAQMDADQRTALWYLKVTATATPDNTGGSAAIFVYAVQTLPGLGDRFCFVASAPQLRDLPEGRDKVTGNGVYYRTTQAEFMCRSMTELDQVWQQLQSDVALLIRDWSKLAAASVSQSVTIS